MINYIILQIYQRYFWIQTAQTEHSLSIAQRVLFTIFNLNWLAAVFLTVSSVTAHKWLLKSATSIWLHWLCYIKQCHVKHPCQVLNRRFKNSQIHTNVGCKLLGKFPLAGSCNSNTRIYFAHTFRSCLTIIIYNFSCAVSNVQGINRWHTKTKP